MIHIGVKLQNQLDNSYLAITHRKVQCCPQIFIKIKTQTLIRSQTTLNIPIMIPLQLLKEVDTFETLIRPPKKKPILQHLPEFQSAQICPLHQKAQTPLQRPCKPEPRLAHFTAPKYFFTVKFILHPLLPPICFDLWSIIFGVFCGLALYLGYHGLGIFDVFVIFEIFWLDNLVCIFFDFLLVRFFLEFFFCGFYDPVWVEGWVAALENGFYRLFL
jgi:hypothetical protein